LSHAIGLDLEISVDFEDIEVLPGDRLLLVSGLETAQPEAVTAAFDLRLPAGGDVSAIVLDVLAAPDAPAKHGDLADLPLRPAPREGDVWDGFVIGKTIYRGRYTILKLAKDTLENREVVLKIPLPAMLQDEIFSAGFMREAWIGSTVRGPNVARYIELPPQRRSSLYLVMPYYRGETLEARLNRPPLMPLPDGIGIALKLCEAVQDLAAIQIVHRDLKPDNIMLLEHNEVRLLDLGLAYLPGIDVRDAVKPGGTLRYMAPELLRGVQANPRSEVYSLAVTLYRMFAGGAYPYGQREAVPLARLRPDLPRWLGKILQTAMAAEPSERFADAGEMAKSLYEGLVSGTEDAPRRRRFQPTKLQLWQAATAVFASGFFVLLLRMLR
jgi:serine/threonine protein kinase